MVSKIMLDANIILDLTLKRSADYQKLRSIYSEIIAGTFDCFITTSIIHTCGYWLTKEIGSNNAKRVLFGLLNDIQVIECPHTAVVEAVGSDIKDIEDCLQYYTAAQNKLECIISRDKEFIKSAKKWLPVYNPDDFLKYCLR